MLRINEMFLSVDGEVNANHQGGMSTFIRLAGCNLSCSYCDAKEAQDVVEGGFDQSIEQILEYIKKVGCKKITITGGEPLLQKVELHILAHEFYLLYLLGKDHFITVETNGSLEIPAYLLPLIDGWIVDFKIHHRSTNFEWKNLKKLKKRDWIKIVVENRDTLDYLEYENIFEKFHVAGCKARIALSPMMGKDAFKPEQILEWMVKQKHYDLYLNMQIHKLMDENPDKYFHLFKRNI